MTRRILAVAAVLALGTTGVGTQSRQATPPPKSAVGAAQKATAAPPPVMVLETAKGTIEIQLNPAVAPKSVAHIVALVRKGFYRGLRFHRVTPTLAQVGDPQTRNVTLRNWWGTQHSGSPIGVAEITKLQSHLRGAVGLAHSGDAKQADSQFYIMKIASPALDGDYTLIGKVIVGFTVVDKLDYSEMIRNCYMKGEGPK